MARIAKFNLDCWVEMSEGKKVLMLGTEKTEVPMTEEEKSTQPMIDNQNLVNLSQEVARENEATKRIKLTYMTPDSPRETITLKFIV